MWVPGAARANKFVVLCYRKMLRGLLLSAVTALALAGSAEEDKALLAKAGISESEWASAVESARLALPAKKVGDPLPPNLWQACQDLPVLDNTCVGIFWDSANLTVGVDMEIEGTDVAGHQLFAANYTLYSVDAGHYCLSEESLLDILEVIPGLAEVAAAIKKIIDETGGLPVSIMSICVDLEDMTYPSGHVDGDVQMSYNFACLVGHCLASGTHDFGHFDLPIP